MARGVIKKTLGRMEDYGLPRPDHEPLEAHPTVSGEFLTRAGCGDIRFKPAIKALEGKRVRFEDDTVEDVDAIVFATGYDMRFPFFDDPGLVPDGDHQLPLFKRMMKPGVPNLFYMALAQPLPPSEAEMKAITVRDEATRKGQYYASRRHTIQVDFGIYCHDLVKETARGEKRAKAAGNVLPVKARAEAVGA